MQSLYDMARDITMKAMFSEYSPPDYPEFVSVANPRKGWEYYVLDDDRGMIKVRVKSGQLWGEHGLSNFWRWIELDTGEEISGYGNFFKRRRADNGMD